MVESKIVSKHIIVSNVMNDVVRMGGKTRIHLLRDNDVDVEEDNMEAEEVVVLIYDDLLLLLLVLCCCCCLSLSVGCLSDVKITLFIK